MNKFIILIACMLFAFAKAHSQQADTLLTRAQAATTMLKNNYGIQVAANNSAIAENNASKLNADFFPTVQALAGASIDRNNSETAFNGALDQNGNPRQDIRIDGAETKRYNASINVDYTIFDGLGRRYNYERLQELYGLTDLQARETIENTTLQLMSVYLEIARLTENLQVFNEVLEVSKQREARSQYRFDYGQVSMLEVLNARVDINTDSINILNAAQRLRNAKRDLNLLMQRDLEAQFRVDTLVTLTSLLTIEDFIRNARENNVRLLQAQSSTRISELDIKTSKSLFLPRIGLSGAYGWNLTENPASAFFPPTTNTSDNMRLGVNLTWNLFDGGRSIVGLRNARVRNENENLLKKQLEQEVSRDLANAKGNYANSLAIFNMQEQNVRTNEENFERTQERFKLGQVSSVEFRQAQVNLLNAQTIKNLAKYDAKLAEYQVLLLAGQLLNISL
ncbi:MAG: TolC family protein [Nonlabens sp.]|nr:TolC family protein [Nonlabens sp.]